MSTNFFILIATICWGIGAIFTKFASNQLHPLIMAAMTVLVYMVAIPIGIFGYKIPVQVPSSGIVFALLSSTLTGAGSLAYFFALQKGQVSTVVATTSVYPVITLFISALFLSEEMSLKKIIGCLLAVISVILITQK